MKFRIKIQFYRPDWIPTSQGFFTVESENREQAKIDITKQLSEAGDYTIETVEVIND